jgi:uncharacterized membrane protein YfcA
MAHAWTAFPLLFLVGGVSGVLNVLAGGGSFLTLPLLIFLGLPPSVANATNRVGVLTQNIAGVWGFHRHDVLEWRWAFGTIAPALVGAALGTWAALRISDEAFTRVLALLMVVVTLWTLLHRGAPPGSRAMVPPSRWWVVLGFFGVGVYGGFVQAGVGFFVLALTTAAGLDLVRGNAVKLLCILLLTALSLALFAWNGRVDWPLGLALGAGNASGAWLGVHIAISRGHRWLRTFVTIAVVVFAIKLWFS